MRKYISFLTGLSFRIRSSQQMLGCLGKRTTCVFARTVQLQGPSFTSAAPFFDAQPRPYKGLSELTSGSKSLRELVGVTDSSSSASSVSAPVVSEAELARVAGLSYLAPPQSAEEIAAAQKSLSGVITWLSKLSQFPLSSDSTQTGSPASALSSPVHVHPASPLELLVSSLGGAGVVLGAAAPPLPGTTLSPPSTTPTPATPTSGSEEVPLSAPTSLLRLRADAPSEGDPAGGAGQDRLILRSAAHTDRCYYTVPAAADDADAE